MPSPIKAMIRSLDRAALTPAMEQMLAAPPADFRAALIAWAEDNQVAI
jgi:phosphotransferase system enzyme I (PtsP)